MWTGGKKGRMTRIDAASRRIRASPETIYRAFAEPGALEQWIPPSNMTGDILDFEFREGGAYRIRLTYEDPARGQGKTTAESDEVEVRFVRLEPGRRIEQEVIFESDDPQFAGTMRVTWTFERDGKGTRVAVRAENVPHGIRPEDHEAGLKSSLRNLARFVGGDR